MESRLPSEDFPRLVLDANIMISALLGTSFPFLLALYEAGVDLMAPVQQIAETRHKLSQRPALSATWIDEQMVSLATVVRPLHPALLEEHAVKARSRLGPRGEPDWPVLAATYAAGAAAWSHDKDLFGSGAAVWSTRILMREMNYVRAGRTRESEKHGA